MSGTLLTPEETRQFVVRDAKRELVHLKAMLELVQQDPERVIKVDVDGISHPFSTASVFIPVIKEEIGEIKKAIDGKSNRWE